MRNPLVWLFIGLFCLRFAWVNAQDVPIYALPSATAYLTSSNTMALADDNRTLVAANMLTNTLSIIRPLQGELVAEIAVGHDPRSVALTSDHRALVPNRGDGTLSLVQLGDQSVQTLDLGGVWPYGVVTDGGQTAYVSLMGSDSVAVVNLNKNRVVETISTPPFPAGLTLWGDFLYVTHFWSGQLSVIYLPERRVIATLSSGADSGLSQYVEINPRDGLAYLPQTRSNDQNQRPTYDSLVFPVVNVVNLATLQVERRARLTLDTLDRPVNMPFVSVVDSSRNILYTANAGSNDVTVLDLKERRLLAHVRVGANPRGLLLSRDGSFLYVHNALDANISIFNTRDYALEDSLTIADITIPVDQLLGQQTFNSATDPRLSKGAWVSCANCHFDGLSDGRVWVGANTPSLFGLSESAPYTWSGTWASSAAIELHIRAVQAGAGFVPGENLTANDLQLGIALDLDILANYVTQLPAPTALPAVRGDVERGKVLFDAQGCADCHGGAAWSDGQNHDVGTGGEINTPSLRWLWASAPYLHDGRAAQLQDVFTLPGTHHLAGELQPADLDALAAYLLTLP